LNEEFSLSKLIKLLKKNAEHLTLIGHALEFLAENEKNRKLTERFLDLALECMRLAEVIVN